MKKILLLLILSVRIVFAEAWIQQFNGILLDFQAISPQWYSHPQPSLERLILSGRGNCVAYCKLATVYALANGYRVRWLTVSSASGQRHRMSIIYDKGRIRWVQSNRDIKEVHGLTEALEFWSQSDHTWKIDSCDSISSVTDKEE